MRTWSKFYFNFYSYKYFFTTFIVQKDAYLYNNLCIFLLSYPSPRKERLSSQLWLNALSIAYKYVTDIEKFNIWTLNVWEKLGLKIRFTSWALENVPGKLKQITVLTQLWLPRLINHAFDVRVEAFIWTGWLKLSLKYGGLVIHQVVSNTSHVLINDFPSDVYNTEWMS